MTFALGLLAASLFWFVACTAFIIWYTLKLADSLERRTLLAKSLVEDLLPHIEKSEFAARRYAAAMVALEDLIPQDDPEGV